MNRRIIAVALTLAGLSPVLLAQEAAEPTPATQAAPVPSESETAVAGVTGGTTKETLSVDFPNAEIRTILRNIADLFELNLVIPEGLQGRASLKLRDVTWKQIFDVLLTPVGYTYVTDGNIIKVVSIESLNVEPAETRIFLLNFARANDIAPTITSMVEAAKGGKVQVDVRSNALVVTERPKRLEKIDEVIKRLDKSTAQVMIEAKFIEIADTDVKNLGVNWASLNGYNVTAGPFTRRYENEQTTVGENGRETNVGDVNFTNGGNSLSGEPGVANGRLVDNLTGQTLLDMSSQSDTFRDFASLVNGTDDSRLTTSVFSAGAFQVVLSALQTLGDSRLVSNPTVVTINNQAAKISVGEQYPIPAYTYNQERGTFEVSGFEYKDIGIILDVTPQVNNSGLINLKIKPTVSSRTGTVSFGGATGAEIPIISVRNTETQVALKDGFTMGLGGLIENQTTNGSTKVPVLGDIPGLGRLFRSESKNMRSRNLVIFITAKTLSPDGGTVSDVFSETKLQKMGVTAEDYSADK